MQCYSCYMITHLFPYYSCFVFIALCVCRHLYWIDDQKVLRSNLDLTDITTVTMTALPLALTIDCISGKLYWSEQRENEILIMETALNNLDVTQTASLSSRELNYNRIAVVQNFIVITSDKDASFALINLDDSTVKYITTPINNTFYGFAMVSDLRKPSRCKAKCHLRELC